MQPVYLLFILRKRKGKNKSRQNIKFNEIAWGWRSKMGDLVDFVTIRISPHVYGKVKSQQDVH